MILVVHTGSVSRILIFFTHPGSRGKKKSQDPGSASLIRNVQKLVEEKRKNKKDRTRPKSPKIESKNESNWSKLRRVRRTTNCVKSETAKKKIKNSRLWNSSGKTYRFVLELSNFWPVVRIRVCSNTDPDPAFLVDADPDADQKLEKIHSWTVIFAIIDPDPDPAT
jgi:hypothetical protein